MESCGNVFETICRLCLSHGNTGNMVCLSDITDEDEDGLSGYDTYGKAVCTITGISIKNTSLALPDKMCARCLQDLKRATTFRKSSEYLLNKQKEDNEKKNTDEPKDAEHNEHLDKDSEEEDGTEKEICADKPTAQESDKKQVDDKVCGDRNSDSDFYWPDPDDELAKAEHLQELAESLNRKERQKKAAIKKISSFDIITDSESEGVDEYQPDEDSSAASNYTDEDDDGTGKNKRRKKYKPRPSTTAYQCNICMKYLSTKSSLRNHIQHFHTNLPLKHICDKCAKKFWTKAELEQHLARVHESPRYECETCEYKCATKPQLVEHMRRHTGNALTNVTNVK
ncbi:zinc-finger associated domain (zf-AD) domain-containing protein [Phthorimaea operculella]|nr:zinc-finger associated domain (zf-AD) domain-containing protein [Phthorimaea operculella]